MSHAPNTSTVADTPRLKDDIGALVFDLGSRSFRVGYSQDDLPKIEIPSWVGVCRDGGVLDAGRRPGAAYTGQGNRINGGGAANTHKYYVDVTRLCVPRSGMEVHNCMNDGMIENWDLFEQIMDYCYTKRLFVESARHSVLFSESSLNTRAKKETLMELMFEKYDVPAIHFSKNSVLAAYASGRSTAIVVDSGATHTTVTALHNGYVIPNTVVKVPFGGDFITKQCAQYLSSIKIPINPHYMVAKKQPVQPNEPPIWTFKSGLPKVTYSWHNYLCKAVVQDFQQSVLEIFQIPYDERLVSTFPPPHYEFPNGYNQTFGNERYKIPELLFNPHQKMGGAMFGLGQMVVTCIEKCDKNLRPFLYNNIVLTGGNSLIQGFPGRLNYDVSVRAPSNTKVKVVAPILSTERRFASWVGGSILGSVGSFYDQWITHQEYTNQGKHQVDKLN